MLLLYSHVLTLLLYCGVVEKVKLFSVTSLIICLQCWNPLSLLCTTMASNVNSCDALMLLSCSCTHFDFTHFCSCSHTIVWSNSARRLNIIAVLMKLQVTMCLLLKNLLLTPWTTSNVCNSSDVCIICLAYTIDLV